MEANPDLGIAYCRINHYGSLIGNQDGKVVVFKY